MHVNKTRLGPRFCNLSSFSFQNTKWHTSEQSPPYTRNSASSHSNFWQMARSAVFPWLQQTLCVCLLRTHTWDYECIFELSFESDCVWVTHIQFWHCHFQYFTPHSPHSPPLCLINRSSCSFCHFLIDRKFKLAVENEADSPRLVF